VRSKFYEVFVRQSLSKYHELKYYEGIKYSMSSELKLEEEKQDEASRGQHELIKLLERNIAKLYQLLDGKEFEEMRANIKKFFMETYSCDVEQILADKGKKGKKEELVLEAEEVLENTNKIKIAKNKKVESKEVKGSDKKNKILGRKRNRKNEDEEEDIPVIEVSDEEVIPKKPKRSVSKDKANNIIAQKKNSNRSFNEVLTASDTDGSIPFRHNRYSSKSKQSEEIQEKLTRGRRPIEKDDSPITKLVKETTPKKLTILDNPSPKAEKKSIVTRKSSPTNQRTSKKITETPKKDDHKKAKQITPEKKQSSRKNEKEEQTTPEFNKSSPVKNKHNKNEIKIRSSRSPVIEDEVDLIITPKKEKKSQKLKQESSADSKKKSSPKGKVSLFEPTDNSVKSNKSLKIMANNITPLKKKSEQKSSKRNSQASKERLLGWKRTRIHEENNRIQGIFKLM
jgi:hypothetical protein